MIELNQIDNGLRNFLIKFPIRKQDTINLPNLANILNTQMGTTELTPDNVKKTIEHSMENGFCNVTGDLEEGPHNGFFNIVITEKGKEKKIW
ncbi:MAG: hypothetical protein AB1599_04610 [Planctomycetota bacterium]